MGSSSCSSLHLVISGNYGRFVEEEAKDELLVVGRLETGAESRRSIEWDWPHIIGRIS